MKNELIQQYCKAQNYFMEYTMKVTYGPIEDRVYNTNMANIWDNILKEIRNKINE